MVVIPAKLKPKAAAKRVTVLGSTGSVGCNTLDLVRHHRDAFVVEAITANRNVALLARQALEFRPAVAVVADPTRYAALREALSGSGIEVAAGPNAVVEAAGRPVDFVMASIVGAAGLQPTLSAVRRGTTVGLANKECLVCAGDLMVAEVRAHGATLLPVDSEHSAIFQVFDFERPEKVDRIILTASGGPFRTKSLDEMRRVTTAEAVAHPNWDMGAKISVDSATMMNKGLELIEAYHLFPVGEHQIDILVHPQSVIHSLVSYIDGSVLAQLGAPDMRTPIGYALAWPDRIATPAPRLALEEIGTLTFECPDPIRFPALRLARHALKEGGAAPTYLNAANEVAVQQFLEDRIGFLDIARVVEGTLERAPRVSLRNLDDVADADVLARRLAEELVAVTPQFS
ncbi:MAG: 1-deoxy-D-xylulose-5-phosphate reductoisomerase [Rhodospirillales bacterium]|nr:1-deoxy-D-xylulose-5-phosphate reductoisomerase [Rhodospirillales bacterium]